MEITPPKNATRAGKARWPYLLLIVAVLAVVDLPELWLFWKQRRIDYPFYADCFAFAPEQEPRRLTPGNGIYYQPSMHPEGTQVVYAGAKLGPPRIWVADLAEDTRTPLSPSDAAALHPAYSWDGERVVFCSDAASPHPKVQVEELSRGGRPTRIQQFHIYSMNRDGTDLRQLTSGNCTDVRPCFSPDGETVLFVSNRGKRFDRLWTIPADGGEEPRMLYDEGRAYRPWYSADGAWIYFHDLDDDRHDIHRIPAVGGKREQITEDGYFVRAHGSFADPNGETLLVHATRAERFGIWELSLTSDAEPRELTIPGFDTAYHATRSRDGVMAFDLPRWISMRRELRRCLRF